MAMTTDEAILINAAVIARAKDRKDDDNEKEWRNRRCVLCTWEIQEGDEYLGWVPLDYRKYQKLFTTPSLTHVKCLDFNDRKSYPHNLKVAVKGRVHYPLLTDELLYDIIQGKETDERNDSE